MSLFASICCLQCGKLYDENSRRTCISSCSHMICVECKDTLVSENCPICLKNGAFSDPKVNFQSVELMTAFQKCLSEADFDKFSKELENLNHGACSECSHETEKLRICVKCTENRKLIKPSVNGTYQLVHTEDRSFTKAKCLAVCANCFIENHSGHKMVMLASIHGILDDFSSEYLLAFGAILEQQIWLEEEYGKWQSVVSKFKSSALRWKIHLRIEPQEEEEMERYSPLNVHSDDLLEIAKEHKDGVRSRRLKMNLLVRKQMDNTRKQLIDLIDYVTQNPDDGMSKDLVPEFQRILEDFPSNLLNLEEQSLIDQEASSTMNTLEEEIKKRVPAPSADQNQGVNYFKHLVVKNELKLGYEDTKVTGVEMEEAFDQFQDALVEYHELKRKIEKLKEEGGTEDLETLTKLCNSLPEELFAKNMAVDKKIIRRLDARIRSRMAYLMWDMYFPKLSTGIDKAYEECIDKFNSMNFDSIEAMHS